MNLNFQYCKRCNSCLKQMDASFFPSSEKNLCLYCYENVHNRTLHKLRGLLGVQDVPSRKQSTTFKKEICPKCCSPSVRKARLKEAKHSMCFCKNCNNIWDSEGKKG